MLLTIYPEATLIDEFLLMRAIGPHLFEEDHHTVAGNDCNAPL